MPTSVLIAIFVAAMVAHFVIGWVVTDRRASGRVKAIRGRIDGKVTGTAGNFVQHERSFLTKVDAQSVFDYFMDFPRHCEWEQGVEKAIEWQGSSVNVKCKKPPRSSPEGRLKGAPPGGLGRRAWAITSAERPTSVSWEVTWKGEDGTAGPIIERLTIATEAFGTRVTLSEDCSWAIPSWGRKWIAKRPEVAQKLREGSPEMQLMIARADERADRFRRAMEIAVTGKTDPEYATAG